MDLSLVNADYTVQRDKPAVYIFARDASGNRHAMKCITFRPYFYAPISEINAMERFPENLERTGIFSRGITQNGIVGVEKLETNLPRDVGQLRGRFQKTFEADILFPIRFLVDKRIRCGFSKQNGELEPIPDPGTKVTRMGLDIEVETNGNHIPDERVASNLLICLTSRYQDPNRNEEDQVTFTARNEDEENDMLRDFLKYAKEGNPDLWYGWNVFFDFAHIVGRMKYHHIQYQSLSPMGYVDLRFDRREVKILGSTVFDLHEGFKKYFQGKVLESYVLDHVAARQDHYGLGMDVPKFDYVHHMNRDYLDKVVPYNQADVEKIAKLDEKHHIIDHFDAIRRIAGCRSADTLVTTRYADVLFLRNYLGEYALPTRTSERRTRETYVGAHVIKPGKGVFNNVCNFDFTGMYPTIIVSFNMSPETITDDPIGAHNIGGVYFKKKPQGIIPKAFLDLMAFKNELKKQRDQFDRDDPGWKLYELRRYASKQALAAMYGIFAYPGSRLYFPQISASTTYIGRQWILAAAGFLEKRGFNVLYGDTDSIYVHTKRNPIKKGREIEEMLNLFFKGLAAREGLYMAPHIEFEQAYERLLFSGKKKQYAGLCIFDGKPTREIKIKGFAARRSDSAGLSRRVQKELIDLIITEAQDISLRDYIMGLALEAETLPLEQIGIPRPLKIHPEDYRTPARNKGILYSNQYLGKHFAAGSRPYVVYIKTLPEGLPTSVRIGSKSYPVDRIALGDDADLDRFREHIDWPTQVYKVVEKKIEPILEAYGLTLSEVKAGHRQRRLEDFT